MTLENVNGIETKLLITQAKRNIERFPENFLIICNNNDLANLRSQVATANHTTHWNFMRRTNPMLFTENGVAMLSSILSSKQAIQVHIQIMRIFTKLRSYVLLGKNFEDKMSDLESNANKIFKTEFERLDCSTSTTCST